MSFLSQGIELPFTNGFYSTRSKPLSGQRCINYYPVVSEQPSLSPESLYASAGIEGQIEGLGGDQNRGAVYVDGVPYYVSGDKLYRLEITDNGDGTITVAQSSSLGTISGSGRVIMVAGRGSSGYEIAIVVPGITAYSFIVSSDTLAVLDSVTNFLSPVDDVTYINGFFIFLQTDTNIAFHSNLNDITTYNALDFYEVVQTSSAKGLIRYRNQLYVFGDRELIPFIYTGSITFAFQPQPNAIIDTGLRSLHGKINTRQSFCFIGEGVNEETGVWLFQSGAPVKISTNAIDDLLQNLSVSELDNAFMMTLSQNGGQFFIITAGDQCIAYNILTGKWNEFRSLIDGADRRWRVNAIVKASNRFFVWDFVDGRVGILSGSLRTEYGESVQRSFTLQPFDNKGKYIQVKNLALIADVGFGGQFVMEFSDNGGLTWGNSVLRDAGATGEYGRIMQWGPQGSTSFSRVLRFGTSSDAPCNINKVLALA